MDGPSMMVNFPLLCSVSETPLPALISPLLALRSTPSAGRSLFALAPIAPSTLIHTSAVPFARTVLESFKREVCWTCFNLVEGRSARWKVRELLDGNAGEAVRWFCTDACWETWKILVGDVGRAAVRAGEDTLSRAAKVGRRDVERGTEQKEDDVTASTNGEIEEAWAKGFLAGQETVRRRTAPRRAGEVPWQQRPQDALLSSDDPDVFRLLISGITERFHASSNPLPSTWTSLTSLVPSLATNARALESNIRMYTSLIAILPIALLPYTTPLTILALLSRDNGNSFGIWSATHDDGSGERGELLAYGIYPSSSYFNHSCCPNLVKSRNGAAFEFRSGLEGVKEGDEVCISYLGGGEVGDREERRNRLMIGWGFWCECVRCCEEEGGSG